MIPSLEALRYHWLGSCWILHLWQQAQCNHTQLAPFHGHGWTRDKDGNRDIYWDTEENRYKVKSRVDLLIKGVSVDVTLRDVDAKRTEKLVVPAADVSTARTLKVSKRKE